MALSEESDAQDGFLSAMQKCEEPAVCLVAHKPNGNWFVWV